MATAARLNIGAWRYEACVRRIRVVGQDLTGADLFMEIRLRPDTPGDPLIGLSKTANAAGDKLVFIGLEDGAPVTTSILELTISGATMANVNALPFAGEVGDNATFAYAMRFGGTTRLYGDFTALAAVIGANAAPTSRPSSGSSSFGAQGIWATATATIMAEEVTLSIDGVEALAPLLRDAAASADRAEAAVATIEDALAEVEDLADAVALITAAAQPLDPIDYELWARGEGAVRLVVTSDDFLVLIDSVTIGDDLGPGPATGETLADIMARPGPLIASRDIASVGDSFAEQRLAEETAKAFDILKGNPPGTTKAYNLGYSSHTSHAVATRVNALAANYKPVGGVIPAGTGVFELIAENSELRAGPVQVFSGGSEGGRAPAYYGRQEIEFFYEGGVPKAQRKAAGAAIEVNDFIPLVCIPYAKNITPATAIDDWRDKTVVISCGRNNVNGFSAARLVADDTVAIKAIIDAVRPWGRRIALTPIWPNRAPGTGIDEPYGSDQRAKVDAINANRLAMWREYYCDTLTPAINGYDTAAGDRVDDFNKGYTARSYRLKYDVDGTTVIEDYLHAGNYVTPGRKSGQQLEGQLAAQFLIAGHS